MKQSKKIWVGLLVSMLLCFLMAGCGAPSEEQKIEEAEELMDDKEYDEAITLYEEILDNNEECVEAYIGLTECYDNQKKYGKALQILTEGYEKTKDSHIEKKIKNKREEDVKNAERIGKAILSEKNDGKYSQYCCEAVSLSDCPLPEGEKEWPEVYGDERGTYTVRIADDYDAVNIWIGEYRVYPRGAEAEAYINGEAGADDLAEYRTKDKMLTSFQCGVCEEQVPGMVYELILDDEMERAYICDTCLETVALGADILGGTLRDVNQIECDVCTKEMAQKYFEMDGKYYATCDDCFEVIATTALEHQLELHLFNTENWREHRADIKPIHTEVPPVQPVNPNPGVNTPPVQDDSKVIRLYSYTDEVPDIARIYFEMHPDYELEITILSSVGGNYQQTLDYKLRNGDVDAPDIYVAEQNFVVNYIKEDMAEYAASYEELGIDVNNLIADAQIAPYAYQVGTRPSDGKIIGLPYQSTAGCFIYNRSVAKDTWGTDDPEFIRKKIGGGSGDWEQFLIAAEELQDKGYAIVPCAEDVWKPMEKSASQGWIVDGKLYIDPKRMEYMDVAKKLYDNGFVHDYYQWSEDWFDSFAERGETKVLGFFGPAWLLQYSMADNCKDTFGDWAVTTSPVGFFWGGDWVLVNKNVSEEKKQVVADFIQWMTLESDENSLQYYWANGSSNHGVKLATPSNKVLSMVNGENEMVAGQNMYEYFIEANNMARGDNLSRYDEMIDGVWRDQVSCYMHGEKTREECLNDFKMWVEDNLNIKSN